MTNEEKKIKAIGLFEDCIPIFNALGDSARQKLILDIANTEENMMNVTELASKSNLSRPAISHHLKVLKDSGIVRSEKKSTMIFYKLNLKEKIMVVKELITLMEELEP